MKNISILSLALLACACGGGSGGSSSSSKSEQQQETVVSPGKYEAFLRPVNTRVYGFINSGKAEISIDQNFSVKLVMDDAPGVVHVQAIQTGRACPQKSDDTNEDLYIDAVEAESVAGKILIPLDDNLEVQGDGSRTFPVGKSYTFTRTGNLGKMIKDLQLPDADQNDRVVRLPANSGLALEGKIIMVYGTYESANLPATVEGRDGMTPAQSIPIACGKIERMPEMP